MDHHQLQTLLQFLVTDASSIAHLAYILDHLSASSLSPSPHLQKWIIRVTSLMHSKDPAARWTAICIAYRMSFLSKSLLVDNAQSWVGIVLPSLSKPEPVPILRASMRYLTLVLCAAGHSPEFQRQVAAPIVPKVSSALLTIAEKHHDQDIKTSSVRALVQLVPLYPSLHKALSQRLFALCHQVFTGSVHHATDSLVDAIVNLYAVLHFLGGKVGGTNLWRNCLDEVLQLSWSAWLALRTTSPTSAQLSHMASGYLRPPNGKLPDPFSHANTMTSDPLTTVALNFDRLKFGISAIVALLRTSVNRPVKVPIGHLAAFCWCLLASTPGDEGQTHWDLHVRVAESAVEPQLWMHACRLLSCLTQTTQDLLAPHTSRLIMAISIHLENSLESSQRNSLLKCAYHLLYLCPVGGATLAISRLLKATILLLSPLYLHQPQTETSSEAASQSRGRKKRRREYEAESVLAVSNIKVLTTADECDTLISALDVVNQCTVKAELPASTHSLANRVFLSIFLSLPSIPPSNLSSDPSFHGRVMRKVREVCVESVHRASYTMSRGTDLVLRSFSSENSATSDRLHSEVDLLLHPRRPPFVRTLPPVDSLSLSSAERNGDEATTQQFLNLGFGNAEIHSIPFESHTRPELVNEKPLALDQQTPSSPPQDRVSPTSVEHHPQTRSDTSGNHSVEEFIPSAAAVTLKAVPGILTASLNLAGIPASTVHAPMLVDGSDHEEVPTIDLGSESDA